jgi:hypothetical protein
MPANWHHVQHASAQPRAGPMHMLHLQRQHSTPGCITGVLLWCICHGCPRALQHVHACTRPGSSCSQCWPQEQQHCHSPLEPRGITTALQATWHAVLPQGGSAAMAAMVHMQFGSMVHLTATRSARALACAVPHMTAGSIRLAQAQGASTACMCADKVGQTTGQRAPTTTTTNAVACHNLSSMQQCRTGFPALRPVQHHMPMLQYVPRCNRGIPKEPWL